MNSRENASRPRKKKPAERLVFPAGPVTGLRALDATGSRFLLSVGGVDGKVSAEIIGDHKLAMGRVLSEKDAADVTAAAHRLQVFDQGVYLLSIKARSARDLSLALRRRGAMDGEAQQAIARMVELRLIDDELYARAVAHSKASSGGISKRRLQQELARRGVAPDLARSAISEALDEVGLDEYEAALTIAQKRMRSLASLDVPTARRRLYAFLARRGYESSVVNRVIATVLEAGDDE